MRMRSLKKQGGWITAAIAGVGLVVDYLGSRKDAQSWEDYAAQALARGKEQNKYNKRTAIQVEAAGQRAAFDENRRAELIASRAIAVSAAGGYTQDITNLIADINGEGNYRASVKLYEYGADAEALRHEGRLAEKYGSDSNEAARAKSKATTLSGYGGIISSLGSFLDG